MEMGAGGEMVKDESDKKRPDPFGYPPSAANPPAGGADASVPRSHCVAACLRVGAWPFALRLTDKSMASVLGNSASPFDGFV